MSIAFDVIKLAGKYFLITSITRNYIELSIQVGREGRWFGTYNDPL